MKIDQSRTFIFWDDEIDLPSDAIYEYGTEIEHKQAKKCILEIVHL